MLDHYNITTKYNTFLGLPSLQIELEKQIARFLGVEAAICFPMGFGTNSMSLPSLANEVLCD